MSLEWLPRYTASYIAKVTKDQARPYKRCDGGLDDQRLSVFVSQLGT